MEDFKFISEGVKNWNNIASSLQEANIILETSVEFLLNKVVPLDTSEAAINTYFGCQNNTLFAVIIQSSKDLEERYRDDLDGVLKDMVVVSATPKLTRVLNDVISKTELSNNQITPEEALKRIASWADEALRMTVMKSVKTAPLIFEVPKSNFEIQGQKKLLFGLKTEEEISLNQLQYDFLLEAEVDSNLGLNQVFYDASMPIPPYKAAFAKGLYEYLDLSV